MPLNVGNRNYNNRLLLLSVVCISVVTILVLYYLYIGLDILLDILFGYTIVCLLHVFGCPDPGIVT